MTIPTLVYQTSWCPSLGSHGLHLPPRFFWPPVFLQPSLLTQRTNKNSLMTSNGAAGVLILLQPQSKKKKEKKKEPRSVVYTSMKEARHTRAGGLLDSKWSNWPAYKLLQGAQLSPLGDTLHETALYWSSVYHFKLKQI